MKLYLHTPDSDSELRNEYKKAFRKATELFVVTAYLTEWDSALQLNNKCKRFRLIIGKDFGITRKEACKKVIKWLPSNRKSQFLVADNISGFHPKAIFWKTINNKYYSIIGSSNLTKAAFETNFEANIYSEITKYEYIQAKNWINEIEKNSIVLSEDWLHSYKEGINKPKVKTSKKSKSDSEDASITVLDLPNPKGSKKHIKKRRIQIEIYNKYKKKLLELFKKTKDKKISSKGFYSKLPSIWSWEIGDRLQGAGWERLGAGSDFHAFADSFLKIYEADEIDRDDVVVEEIDKLATLKVPTRKAFLSEMLCLAFPESYPVLNKPIHKYLSDVAFKPPVGASEGSKYIDIAKKLRFSLLQNPNHPAKNLAELDTVIWLKYGEK